MTEQRRASTLLLLGLLTTLFAVFVALTGGIDTRIGGVAVRSRSWERPATVAVLLLSAWLFFVRHRLAGRPVYLCFDMDFFDPSCAPGVCAPTWGGASSREGLQLLQGLAGLDFVAFDVNTVSPPHDVGGMTAFLAATVMLECLYLACRRPVR